MTLADLHFTTQDKSIIATLTGEIDLSNADSIGQALTSRVSNQALALIFDLSRADYLDSAAIQLMYRLRDRLQARGQSLKLVIPRASPADDALRLAGVASHLDTVETVEAALHTVG
jgi:anti-anti-sigma factor